MRRQQERKREEEGRSRVPGVGEESPETRDGDTHSAGNVDAMASTESDKTECRNYDEGATMAFVSKNKLKLSALGRKKPLATSTSQGSSIFRGPQPGELRMATDVWVPQCPALEPTADDRGPSSQKAAFFPEMVGCTLGECGPGLLQLALEVLPLRSQTTGRRTSKTLFPLPTSREKLMTALMIDNDTLVSWMLCVVIGLNSYWGCELFFDGDFSDAQLSCIQNLFKDVTQFGNISSVVPPLTWDDFFKVKSIDYKGDEVQVARWFTWKNVQPALPKEVGKVPLAEVCTL